MKIRLTVSDLHRLAALATALNTAGSETKVDIPVGPYNDRRTAQVDGNVIEIDPDATLPALDGPAELV